MIGTHIAHYRITAKLGAGGMGEVYRAEDSKLGREVAIKVLPAAVAQDPERLERFEREAQVLAALNHPHIAQIYGLETSGATPALVLELVPGPTLAERLERGAPPLEETLVIARQIAEALESAHEKGIVHRDLKPANVKLTPEGKVKVLDFGLAKAMDAGEGASGATELAHSPTLTMGATVQGMILGTAAYMAPEQAKALPVDKRADIWAFGVILHELLTGESLFGGDTVGDTLAAVIRADLDLAALPATTPPALRRLLRRCLERKPANRLRDIGDARIVIDELLAGGGEEERAPLAAAPPARRLRWLPWALAALAAGVAAWSLLRPSSDRSTGSMLTADLALVADQRYFFQGDWGGPVILAPDGESIVYGAQATAGSSSAVLWTRSLATGAEHPIEGTEGAYAPFFSPDGRSVGFFAGGKLKITPIAGGPALELADTSNGRGGAWAPDGTIIYSPAFRAGLFVVPARGGEPRPLTRVDTSRHSSHRWPTLTADGKGVVFLALHHSTEFEKDAGLRFARLDGSDEHAVLPARANGALVGDRLLYLRETTLFAQRFDGAEGKLLGAPAPVARNVLVDMTTWRATFSATPRRLVYATGSASGGSRLSWLDHSGRIVGEVAKTGVRGDLRLSPDGTRVVESRGDRSREDLWILDLERGAESRFTFEDATAEWSPVWSPDGRFVYYVSTNHPDLRDRIFRKRSDGTGAPELVYESTRELDLKPGEISPDGSVLSLTVGTGPFDSDSDVALLPLDGSGPLRRLFETPYQEGNPRFSHDGRHLAFATTESGVSQVVVVALDRSGDEPRVTAKWQVSLEGGGQSVWSAKDDEIVFLDTRSNLMSVAVTHLGDGLLRFGTPTVLFSTSAIAIRSSLDLAADGRILVNHFGEERSEPLKLIENWMAQLSD